MRGWLIIILAFGLVLGPAAFSSAEDPPISTEALTVDHRWIDIFQSDDRGSLEVIEYIFYNNTGTDTFNGTVYAWVPTGADVISTCCGNAPNMACRMKEGGYMLCFDMEHLDENIVHGVPFEPSTFMSYFEQSATITISGTSQNYSDSSSIEVTVGRESTLGTYPEITGEGIHITTRAVELGALATIQAGMPEKLAIIQPVLNVTNNATTNETVELEISGLPEGWNGLFLNETGNTVDNVTVLSNESRILYLHMQVPSYILEVQLNYFLSVEGYDEPNGSFVFGKEFLYDNGFIESYVLILPDDNLTTSGGLRIITNEWSEADERMWFVVVGTDIEAGESATMTILWESPLDLALIALVAVVIVLSILIVFLLMRKKGMIGPKVEKEEDEPEVKAKPDKELSLEEKKRTLLLAMKRLKKDHEEGRVPDDVYEELHANYKKSAIEVLKQIDEQK
ncbi:MAG: hypothetical protein JSV43_07555 [Methanobacteriota archaeon]|nr:MAG: hypothetical protein JSV43_07555 [Euryarchaeota archaeon]